MKKLLSINIGKKGFRTEYNKAVQELGLQDVVIRARNSCFVLEDGTARLFHQNQEILPEEIKYVFIRVVGDFALMTSLVAQYFHFHSVPLSDEVYMQHTSNEEKITQMLLFTLFKVPIPKTVLFTVAGFSENKEIIQDTISFPCVLKTNGSQGRNVWKINDQAELESKISALTVEMAMIQEYIPNTSDIRALYMHGDIIGAIERSSTDGFRNNVSAGGTATAIELTAEETALAQKACETLGRSFAGVDIVRTPKGPLFFEVNLGPQIYGFETATGTDVPAELLQRIKGEYFNDV